MSVTDYPRQAENFKTAGKSIDDKLNNIKTSLNDIDSILKSGHNDFLSLKTLDTNKKLKEDVNKALSSLRTDVSNVKDFSEQLDKEEAERRMQEKMRQKQKEEEEGGTGNE